AWHRLAGETELPADLHRQQSPHQQEEQADEQELDADDLVIGGEDVLAPEAHRRVMRVVSPPPSFRPSGCNARPPVPPAACCFLQAANSSGVCTNPLSRML